MGTRAGRAFVLRPTRYRYIRPRFLTYAQEVISDSPSVYYRFSETTGATFLDSTGNGRSGAAALGIFLGSPSLITTDADAAVRYVPNAYVAPPTGAWQNPGSFTIECVVKPDASGLMQFVSKAGSGNDWKFGKDSSNRLKFSFWISTTQYDVTAAVTNGTLTTNSTYHVAATYDGSVARVFSDGVEVANRVQSGTVANNTNMLLGTNQGGSEWYSGYMDEWAFYGSALSPSRILAHAQAAGLAFGPRYETPPRRVQRFVPAHRSRA